ncbi:MAG: bifunctional nuclease family protein [Bacteroidota bacterium]
MEQPQELVVVGLSASTSQSGFFVVLLESLDTKQRIPIIIGEAEAQSIAIAMEGMQPPQPLTHDLFPTMITSLGGKLKQVEIYEMQGEVFLTRLLLQRSNGPDLTIDARCSDAIALAVRINVPIYSYDSIISVAIIDPEFRLGSIKRGSLQSYSLVELARILEKLLEKEDYKSAGRIRDLISKRKNEL